jgi:hypothetical protein
MPTDLQHIADLLAAQFLLLWILDPTERIRRINDVRADLEYEGQLRVVSEQMEAV